MSGHSKWSQIKYKKQLSDQKRSAEFAKLSRAISIAARGNPDPKTNARLKAAVDKAREFNMPNDNMERAIKQTSEKSDASLKEMTLEILAPGNVACIVIAITDNQNRTISELKTLAGKFQARIVNPGSLIWMFKKIATPAGIEYIPNAPIPPDPENEQQLEAFLSTLDDHEDIQDVFTNTQ